MKRQKGRPTKTEQIQIQDIIRPFFEQNISSTTTSQKTGINIKTVCKYFDEWYELIVKSQDGNFIKRQQKERERIILHYETLIIEEYDLLETVKEEFSPAVENLLYNRRSGEKRTHLCERNTQDGIGKTFRVVSFQGDKLETERNFKVD